MAGGVQSAALWAGGPRAASADAPGPVPCSAAAGFLHIPMDDGGHRSPHTCTMTRKKPPPDDRPWAPPVEQPWAPTGNDRATLDGVVQQVDDGLDAWLAAGGERRKKPRWPKTEPLGLDPLNRESDED